MSTRGNGKAVAWLRAHVDYDGEGCLPWPFCLCNGYGHFGHEGENHYAHRFMCTLVKGPPPTPFHEAAHSCGRGDQGCVHPQHLDWKTTSGNQLDRALHGTKNSWAARGKLTPEEAAQIRALKGQKTQQEIAAMFGISRSQVSWVMTGKAWVRERKGYVHKGNKFYARLFVDGREIQLGGFDSEEEAHACYLAENARVRAAMRIS